MFQRTVFATVGTIALLGLTVAALEAGPTLKGPLDGIFDFNADTGFATYAGSGHLTLMGKVGIYGEFAFAPGEEPGSIEGIGVCAFEAANGDILVSNVLWIISDDGQGDLEFRWPGEVMFSDGTTVNSTGRFVELPFAGLRATSTTSAQDAHITIRMTGEIIDPDPID